MSPRLVGFRDTDGKNSYRLVNQDYECRGVWMGNLRAVSIYRCCISSVRIVSIKIRPVISLLRRSPGKKKTVCTLKRDAALFASRTGTGLDIQGTFGRLLVLTKKSNNAVILLFCLTMFEIGVYNSDDAIFPKVGKLDFKCDYDENLFAMNLQIPWDKEWIILDDFKFHGLSAQMSTYILSCWIHCRKCKYIFYLYSQLTHWGCDKMTPVFQTTFSNAFS